MAEYKTERNSIHGLDCFHSYLDLKLHICIWETSKCQQLWELYVFVLETYENYTAFGFVCLILATICLTQMLFSLLNSFHSSSKFRFFFWLKLDICSFFQAKCKQLVKHPTPYDSLLQCDSHRKHQSSFREKTHRERIKKTTK